jgi:hypothetical protein
MIDANNAMNTVLIKLIERLTPEFLSTLKVKNDLTFDKRSSAKIRELFSDLEIKKPEYSVQWIFLTPSKWQTILQDQKLINVELQVKYYYKASEHHTSYDSLYAHFDCTKKEWYNHNKPLPSLTEIQEKQKEHKMLKEQEKQILTKIALIEREFKINRYSEIEK